MWRRIVPAATLIVAMTLPAIGAGSAQSAGETPYPDGHYTPPAATYGAAETKAVPIRADDGAVLRADIVRPTDPKTGAPAAGPFPVLLTQDIYGGGIGALEGGTGLPGQYFVQRGYIFIHLNARGTGATGDASDGSADLFSFRSGLDGLEVAYWAADPHNLAGANGQVGLEGCSALGISQMVTLIQLGRLEKAHASVHVPGATPSDPSHDVPATKGTSPILAAIPQCPSGGLYRDTFFDNGIPSPIVALGAAPVTGVALSGPPQNPTDLFGFTGFASILTGGRMQFATEAYWQDRDWVTQAPDLAYSGVPLLLWGGWGEGAFIGEQWLYAALENATAGRPSYLPMQPDQKPSGKYHMIVGDWGHAGGLDQGIELEWYDTWIKGVQTGLRSSSLPFHMKELPSAATPRWVSVPRYPMTTTYTPAYLASGGALAATAPTASGSDTIAWAPVDSTSYSTAPFTQDLTLIGPSALRIWARSTNTNMQLFAELLDVAPAGTATAITHGSVLASRRSTNPAKSWSASNGLPIQPYLTLDGDDPIAANTAVKLDIPIEPVTWRLLKGHRLKLMVAGQATQDQCALNTKIGAAPTGCLLTKQMAQTVPGGVYTLLHDPAHPSVINLPLVPSSTLITTRSGVTPTSSGVALPLDWAPASTASAQPATPRRPPASQAEAAGLVRPPTRSLAATGGGALLPSIALLLAAAGALVGRVTRRAQRG